MYQLSEIRAFCEARGKYKVILDANLLLLFLVGACDTAFIAQHKCTQKYTKDDYALLLNILRYFKSEIVITPHILAEVSDLSRRDITGPRLTHYITRMVERLKTYKEEHVTLERLLESKIHLIASYGFPDMSIIEGAKTLGAAVITDDYALSAYAITCKIPSVSFSALRAEGLVLLSS